MNAVFVFAARQGVLVEQRIATRNSSASRIVQMNRPAISPSLRFEKHAL